MAQDQLIALIMNGGFTGLAAFLVWRLATASEADREAAKERENRMAKRIDLLERNLVDLTAQGVEAQNNLSGALRELKETLSDKPCLLAVEDHRNRA